MTSSNRTTGVFCHISSLPGPFGCGTLGQQTRDFIDLLAQSGATIWQILPADALDGQASPYMAKSAMAGNSAFVDFDDLAAHSFPAVPRYDGPSAKYDFAAVTKHRRVAFQQLSEWIRNTPEATKQRAALSTFRQAESGWLDDYLAFATLREVQGLSTPWWQWPNELKIRDPRAIADILRKHEDIHQRYLTEQYLFHQQWFALRDFAARRGIEIVGDVPIYIDGDSADVWANQDYFALDEDGAPAILSGTPPDYFCADGQCWGSPVYRWDALEKNGYDWWIGRLARAQRLYDRFRIDHFRAFAAYWAIPAKSGLAEAGSWQQGPGGALLSAAYDQLPNLQIIVEDLGAVDEEVFDLRDAFGLPGMHVVQLIGDDPIQQPHYLKNHRATGWAYLGNHDTQTTLAWLATLSSAQKVMFRDEIAKVLPERNILDLDGLLAYTLSSPCQTSIICLQDLLGLGPEGTMNTPGTIEGNWDWRATDTDDLPKALAHLSDLINNHRSEA